MINLIKHVWDLQTKNYKMLLRKKTIKQVNEKVCHIHTMEDSLFLKCQFSPNWPVDSV